MVPLRPALVRHRLAIRSPGGTTVLAGMGMVLLLGAIMLGTSIGTSTIPLERTLRVLGDALPLIDLDQTWTATQETILLQIRLPRVIAAALVGAALSGSGVIFQGLFRNPLVEPYIIGASSGAAFAAVIGFLILPQAGFVVYGFSWVPLLAFVGSLVTVIVVYLLAQQRGRADITILLLAGIAVSAFLNALMSFIMLSQSDAQFRLGAVLSWLLGGIGTVGWDQFALLIPFIATGLLLARLFAVSLNTLALGEEQASIMGVSVEWTKAILIAASSLMTAAAVAAAGLVGFVGLLVPHAVRLLMGPDHRRLLWVSALYGAIFVVMADLVARTLIAPQEIPLGVITGVVGGPFFLLLLRQTKRRYGF